MVTSSLTTPRGGATPLPRRAQPLLLLFRSNPPTEGGEKQARAFIAAPLATSHMRSAHTAAAVGAAFTTHPHSLPPRLLLAARRTLGAG